VLATIVVIILTGAGVMFGLSILAPSVLHVFGGN
jgi:hypothetical protein